MTAASVACWQGPSTSLLGLQGMEVNLQHRQLGGSRDFSALLAARFPGVTAALGDTTLVAWCLQDGRAGVQGG